MSRAVTKPARRTATYEDLLAVPEPLVAEILFGELVTHPRPASRHARAASRLEMILGAPFDLGINGPGGWVFFDEPELHLGEHVVVPDLAAWRGERLSEYPETAWFEVAPDWVCEVLSPSTESYDRGDKQLIYAEAGVANRWQINPVLKMLEVYELKTGKWLLLDVIQHDAQVAAAPFAEFSFSLSALWSLEPLRTARKARRPSVKKKRKRS
ncbi:MAG TPA: Uma2 family endonuclease [Hyphomicrobiaceae bacterium]|jgi:Uma2 family endonuclease